MSVGAPCPKGIAAVLPEGAGALPPALRTRRLLASVRVSVASSRGPVWAERGQYSSIMERPIRTCLKGDAGLMEEDLCSCCGRFTRSRPSKGKGPG